MITASDTRKQSGWLPHFLVVWGPPTLGVYDFRKRGTSAEQISVSWSNFTISGEKSKKVQHLKIALFLVIQ